MSGDDRFMPRQDFTPRIGDLVTMLEYTRTTTIDSVCGLNVDELDFQYCDEGNSIAALLAHIAAVEWAYAVATFERRKPNAQEKLHWGPALRLGSAARSVFHGREVAEYIEALAGIRCDTLQHLVQCDDAWLLEEFTLSDGTVVNHHWAWFHVFKDELSHRGQILLIRNHLLPKRIQTAT